MEKNIIRQLKEGLERLANRKAYFVDPAFGTIDPRPVAEYVKSLLYLGEMQNAEKYLEWLLSVQNKNGSWNEVLNQEFSEESCVATAVIGRILLIAYEKLKKRSLLDAVGKAITYVKEKEFSPGYYIKSIYHYSDVLNVSATCAAFFQKAYEITKKEELKQSRDRAIFNTVRYQFKDGAYPYAARIITFPYEYHLNVRDPHYHALTLYFLLLADPLLTNYYLRISYKKAIKWLEEKYRKGKIDWADGEHMFSVGVTAAYSYAAFCSSYAKKDKLSEKILQHIAKTQRSDGLFNRYEPSKLNETIKGVFHELFEWQKICPKEFSFATRLLRCRQRLSRDLKERKKQQISLYYSTQILDCLTERLKQKSFSRKDS